jgi:hypothetical protein
MPALLTNGEKSPKDEILELAQAGNDRNYRQSFVRIQSEIGIWDCEEIHILRLRLGFNSNTRHTALVKNDENQLSPTKQALPNDG